MFQLLHSRIGLHSASNVFGTSRHLSTEISFLSNNQAAGFLASAKTINSIPKPTGLPEIIVTGRANVGKSTLLNSVLKRRTLLSTSSKAGHTKALNFFLVGPEPGKFIVVDAPGYGARGRPEWGELFDHYVRTRKQLKRIYILFNAKHGLNAFDKGMLSQLSTLLLDEQGVQTFTLQSVITKMDDVPVDALQTNLSQMKKDIWEAAPLCLPPIITSAEMKPPFGIEELRKNIESACEL